MKKIYTKQRFSFAAIMLLSTVTLLCVLIYACKKPTEGIKVVVDSSLLFPAPTLLKFTNADSTSTNQPGSFTVSITGPGAQYVQLSSGGTDFTTSGGLLSLALTKDANPSPSNPIVFTVSASIAGFAPILQNITITQNALSVYPIKALEYSRPAVGTTVLTQSTTLTGNTVPATILTTAKTATMTENATISFQAGTQLLDANGNPISAAKLNSNVVQYGTGTDASLQAFPGGFSAPVAFKSDLTPIAGGVNFVTGGLLQMNLDADGVPVKKFSKPVAVTMELNNNLTNFVTGKPLSNGDVIPVWSLNETTGQWTNDGTATVSTVNGKYVASFSITHLSCWNLDWSWGSFGAYQTCGSSLNVTVNTSDPAFKGGPYEIVLQTPSGQYLGALHGATISNGFVAKFASTPSIPLAKIVVSGGIPYTRVQSSLFNPCTAGSVAVTVPVGTSNPVNVDIDITGICKGKDVTVLPSATFELYQQNGTTYTDAGTVQLVNGKASTGLQVGKLYYLTTTYNKTDYKTGTFSVSKSDFAIPSLGNGLVVNAAYNATTNTLKFTGTIPIDCN